MNTCPECNQPTETLMTSGLVKKQVCPTCYDRLANEAIAKATGQCNPKGDAPGVTTKTVEVAVKESIS